jgi:hypothetical protein
MTPTLEPNGEDRQFARGVHREFAGRPLSRYIPSERSLTWLCASLRAHRPRRVLEFGGGIGTITAALLRHPCAVERLVTTEEDPRFRAILRGEDDPRHTVVATPDDLAALDYRADLVVLDGGFADTLGHPLEAASVRDGTLLFVDGDRARQRLELQRNLAERDLRLDLSEHGLPRLHTFLYVNWRRPSVRLQRTPKGCWLGQVTARQAGGP